MKFNMSVECTPQEARAFFGLPDVAPMQQRMMEELETRLRDNLRSLDPDSFVKVWMPTSIQGWQDLQRMFWAQTGASVPKE